MAEAHHLASAIAGFFSDRQNMWFPPFVETTAGLTARQASWRPGDGFHNIWEIVNHVRFWHQVIHLRLQRKPVDRQALGARDGWPPAGEPEDEAGWEAARHQVVEAHRAVVSVVDALTDRALTVPLPQGGRRWKLLHGLIAHTAYHTAQVVMLRRLQNAWIVDWRERAKKMTY